MMLQLFHNHMVVRNWIRTAILLYWVVVSPVHRAQACTFTPGPAPATYTLTGPVGSEVVTCTSCVSATIQDCANVLCIGDNSCNNAVIRTKYLECSSFGGYDNAACLSTSFFSTCLLVVGTGINIVGTTFDPGYYGTCNAAPSSKPSVSVRPSSVPTSVPSSRPSLLPSTMPSSLPTSFPSSSPSLAPVLNTVGTGKPTVNWTTILRFAASGALVLGFLGCLLL